MRKILFILFLLNSPSLVNAYNILYTNISDGNKCYIKNSSDTSTGTILINNGCLYPEYSSDGKKIIYTNTSDGSKCYIKSSSDTSTGTAVTNGACKYPVFSPDGLSVIYSNTSDGGKLYKKSSSDTSTGTAITSVSSKSPIYSPDGLYIYYGNESTSYIYKKSSSDTSNGTAIFTTRSAYNPDISPDGINLIYESTGDYYIRKTTTTTPSAGTAINSTASLFPRYSPDGLFIIYTKQSDQRLYIKNSSDTSNGTGITTIQANWAVFQPVIIGTCSDGIQNQDETGIDVGGICGLNTFDYNGDFFKGDNIQCSTKQYNDPAGSVSRFTDFGDMTPTPFGDGSGETVGGVINNFFNIYGDIGYDDCTSNCLNKDAFRGVFFNMGSYLPHEVMKYNSSKIANQEFFPGRTTPLSDKDPRIRIFRKRNGAYSSFNTIQCSGTGGTTGCEFATLGDITNGAFVEKISKYDFQPCASDIPEVGNTCTILFNVDGQYADLHIQSGFTGMRFGTTTSAKINKVECKNDSYGCQWINTGTGFFCGGVTKYDPEIGFIDGQCDISPEGYCGPVDDFRNPGFNEHAVLDGSGNVVGIAPGYTDNVDLNKDVLDDIFSCPDYESWIDTPSCILQITKNIYTNFKKGINNLRKGPNSMINTVEKIGSGTSQRQFSQVDSQGVNMVDTVFRGAWNSSLDKNQSLNQWSRAAFYMSILLALLAVVLTILLIRKNKG